MIGFVLLFFQPDSTRTDDIGYMIGYYGTSFLPMIILFILSIFLLRAIRKRKGEN